ncbi:MAG: CRISPR system precrRNA processing endoribonuclease RAMP protein Cas6, partial [Candidatus Competibacteraceae bacterium]
VPAGTALVLELTLFGRSNHHLPHLIHALDQAGQRGLHGSRLQLKSVSQQISEEWRTIHTCGTPLAPQPPMSPAPPPCPKQLTLVLETPLRGKAKEHLMTPETFSFGAFFALILRRISLLTAFHTDTLLETHFAELTRAAYAVDAVKQTHLHWHDWTRYSTRQRTPMQMGGLLGEITFSGDQLSPFWPYLWLGQWTHAGKATSMGLGRYRIEWSLKRQHPQQKNQA